MDKIIKVSDSQVHSLLTFYEGEQAKRAERIKEEKQKLAELEREFQEGEVVISTLKGNTPPISQPPLINQPILNGGILIQTPINYPKVGSWWDKIQFLLYQKKTVLFATQIVDLLYAIEPKLKEGTKEELRKNGINIYSTLSHKHKRGELGRIKVIGEYKYGFKKWFDEDGRLKPQFESDNELIVK